MYELTLILGGALYGAATYHICRTLNARDWGDHEPEPVQDDPAMYQSALDDLPAYLKRQAE